MFDDLQNYVPGQTVVSAKDMNTLGQVVRFAREITGADAIVDGTGAHFRRKFPSPGIIPVKLTQNSGSNGNKTTAPTYTYDLKAFVAKSDNTTVDGATLGTNKTPLWPRPIGSVTAAAWGIAMPAYDGGYVLLYAHEVQGRGSC